MTEREAPLQNLAIFLAKPGLTAPSDLIEKMAVLTAFPVADGQGSLGTLYVQRQPSNPPKWGRFFAPQIEQSQLGWVSSTSAVFHVVLDGHTFLLTFGQGRHLIKAGCWEDRFGLRVTLNSIGENRVRSIDKNTLDTIGLHSRVQISKEAAPSEFGLDVERDLLRAITGTPIDKSLGNTLSGLDSLHANVRVTIPTLRDLLSRYLVQYAKETFKETFPWVDHISDVKDAVLRERLDSLMLQTVGNGSSDKCWLTIPEPVEWTRIAGFRNRKGARYPILHDISFDAYLEDYGVTGADITMSQLTSQSILAVDGEGIIQYKWTIYKCVYCEVEDDGQTYLLSGGRWYKVASNFVGQVNEYYANIPRLEWTLPEYKDASEGAYNERAAQEDAGRFTLMDEKFIMIGGGHSKVEFCDLISDQKDLIHVKRYGGAGVLSHLFSQGVVSAETFVSDSEFREKLNNLLPERYRLGSAESRPDASSYRVVFAIVSREQRDDLTLPFFSRLSLRHAVRVLGGFGYQVALAKISMNEEYAKTKAYKGRRA